MKPRHNPRESHTPKDHRNPQVAKPNPQTTSREQTAARLHVDRRNDELYRAAGAGDVALVKSLLALGADPSYRGEEETPLHETIIYGHSGRMEVAKLLIEQSIHDRGIMSTNRNGRSVDCYLDADSDFGTPLGIAVDNDDIPMVRLLLESGAHPDADGCSGGTPLHRAAKNGNVQVLAMLLDRMEQLGNESSSFEDTSVDVCSSRLEVDETTPLHVASREGQLPAVELLVAAGADINAADADGETPLCKAARAAQTKVAEWLLAKGAAVDGTKGKSPVAVAASVGAQNVVAMLLKAGARCNTKYDGATALRYARSGHHKDIAKLLQEFQKHARAKVKRRRNAERQASS